MWLVAGRNRPYRINDTAGQLLGEVLVREAEKLTEWAVHAGRKTLVLRDVRLARKVVWEERGVQLPTKGTSLRLGTEKGGPRSTSYSQLRKNDFSHWHEETVAEFRPPV